MSIFVTTLLTEKVQVHPQHIDKNIKKHIEGILRAKFESKCSHNGYVKHNSIKVIKYSLGKIQAASRNGDVKYTTQFQADVCNPMVKSVLPARVVSINQFGIFAEIGTTINGKNLTIIQIIITRNSTTWENEVPLENYKIGDQIVAEIYGKKFELNDKRITLVGRTVNKKSTITFDADVNIVDDVEVAIDDLDDLDQESDMDEDDEDANKEKDGEESDKDEAEEEAVEDDEFEDEDDEEDDDPVSEVEVDDD